MLQVGEGDFFWDENGRSQFPKVAEEVDAQLQKYKQVAGHNIRLHSSLILAHLTEFNTCLGCAASAACVASRALIPA